jgi:flagellar biosynthesis protein FlhG
MPDPVRVIAVTSGKGGVGKTNVSVNLSAALAAAGERVLLMDADLGLANVDVLLGLSPEFDLQHVINGEKTLDEVVIPGPAGFQLIPASSGVEHMAELTTLQQASLITAFSELKTPIDTLIVDTAAGISGSVVSFAKACQEVIVVVCDEPTSLTDAYALIKVMSTRHGVSRFQMLANMVKDENQGLLLYDKLLNTCDRFLNVGLGYLGAMPFDDQLRAAVKAQQPVVSAEKVKGWPAPEHGTGQLQFFVERLFDQAGGAAAAAKT